MLSLLVVCCKLRDEWTEAIQMVADKLQRQEEERIQCSPTSNIDNMVEEEMDISTTQHKRKVTRDNRCAHRHTNTHSLSHTLCSKYINYSSCSLSCNGLLPLTACNFKNGPLSHRFVSTWNGPLNNKGVNWFSQIKVPWQVKAVMQNTSCKCGLYQRKRLHTSSTRNSLKYSLRPLHCSLHPKCINVRKCWEKIYFLTIQFTRWNIRGSLRLIGVLQQGPWTSLLNFMTFWQVALNILYVTMRQTLRPTEQQTKQRLTCLFWCYRTEYRNFILFGTDQNVTIALSRYRRLALDVSKSSNHVDQIDCSWFKWKIREFEAG